MPGPLHVHRAREVQLQHRAATVRVATLLAVAAILTTSCGNNSLTNSSPSDRNTSNEPPPAAPGPITTAARTKFSGIILATCSNGSAETLTSFDPTNGAMTTRAFTLGSGQSAAMDCFASVPTGQALRQEFNRDFTRMAVVASGMADGGTHVGYVANDTNGMFVDLTRPSSGYADPPNESVPIFNPATGRIWFSSSSGSGSVDPDAGPASSKNETPDSSQSSGSSNQHAEIFYFTPDGRTPIGLVTGAYNIYSLDGKTEVDYSIDYRVGYEGKVDYSTPIAETSDGAEVCWPKWFTTANTFICLPTDRTQIYKMTISPDRKKIVQTALLPNTRQPVSDVVAKPDGTEVAFISSASGTPALYTASTAGGTAPRKVADLADDAGRPIDWIP
jgi:hypothetical protein